MITPSSLSRRSFLGLVGAGTVAVAAGCGGDDDEPSGGSGSGDIAAPNTETFEVWVLEDDAQNPIQQSVIKSFNAMGKGTAKLVPNEQAPYSNKLRVAMGTDSRPDVFFNWGGGSIRQYVRNDLLVDLSPALEADQAFKSSFLPAVLDAGKIEDKFYGVPMRGMQPVLIYYNKSTFEKAKVDAPPTTWDELLDTIDKLKAVNVVPFALAGSQPWTELMWFEYLTDRIGGAEVFPKIAEGEEGAWQDPAIAQTVDRVRELIDRGAFGTNYSSVNYEQGGARTLYARGRAAMHLMGSWEATTQLDEAPKFAKEQMGWFAFPTVDGGKGDPKAIVGNPTNYFSISKSSGNVGGAVEFLKQMSSDSYVDALVKGGDVPAVADIEDRLETSTIPEFAKFTYGLVRDAPSFQLSWDQAIENKLAQPMLDAIAKVFLKQLDAAGFVDAMENVQ